MLSESEEQQRIEDEEAYKIMMLKLNFNQGADSLINHNKTYQNMKI